MDTTNSSSLVDSLADLAKMDESHADIGYSMAVADGGAMYGMDLFTIGALNRSKAHIAGFTTLIDAKNLICAGALLRLQLDTAIRFYASYIVDKPHDFALAVLAGKQVRHMRDSNGHRMTDGHLVRKLSEEYEWVPRVYERASGYVHFSEVHLLSAFSPHEEQRDKSEFTFDIKVSAEDKPLPDWVYIDVADAFRGATAILLRYVKGWVYSKENPGLMAEERRGRAEESERDV